MIKLDKINGLMKYIAVVALFLGVMSVGLPAYCEDAEQGTAPAPAAQTDTSQTAPEAAGTAEQPGQSEPSMKTASPTTPYLSGAKADQALYSAWITARDAVTAKDYDTARQRLSALTGMCSDLGITSYEPLSAAMVKEGRKLVDSNDMTGAMLLFDTAIMISPNYPEPYYSKGWSILSRNKHKALVAIDSFIDGFTHSTKDFWWDFTYIGNKSTSLLFALAALFSLFGLFMAVRYIPLIAHDIAEKTGRTESEDMVKFAVVPAIFTVVLLALGYWWAVTLALLVLWVYFNKKEKTIAIVFFLLLVFMPEVMDRYSGFIQAGENKMLWVLDRTDKGRVTQGTEKYLKAVLENEPDNEHAMFALAKLLKIQRRYDESAVIYGKLVEKDPENAVYRINSGNLHFLTGQSDKAIEDYKAALEYSPDSPLAHYNMSRIYGEMLKFTERDEQDRQASKLAPDYVAELKARSGVTPLRLVLDATVPCEDMWDTAFKDTGTALASSLWSTTVKVMPLDGARFAGIGFIILVIAVNFWAKNRHFSHYCNKCGKVSCTKCQKPYYNKELCPQCHQIFVKLDGVEARDRLKKTLEIREKDRKTGLVHRVSSLLLPGSGHYLGGYPVKGFIYSGIFIFLIKDIFFGSFLENQYSYGLGIIGPDTVIMLILLVVFYVVTQLDIYRITKKSR